MLQCSGVLRISERKLYKNRISDTCKKHTSLKPHVIRQYSEMLSISERNLHSPRVPICVNNSNLVYKLYILVKYIYLSLFSFFLRKYNGRSYPEDSSKQCDSAIMFEIEASNILKLFQYVF